MIATSLVLLFALLGNQASDPRPGALVIVGGGGTPPAVFKRCLELGGGNKARVLVIPFASTRKTAGESTVETFRGLGAEDVALASKTSEELSAQLAKATVIWMPGGAQGRLIAELERLAVRDLLIARHRAGTVVGGTSAGAAVMSLTMIQEDAKEKTGGPRAVLGKGLGLWPTVVVDQHFSARKRFERLFDAVQKHPRLLGIGIDEKTAVLVQGDVFEVLGARQVLVIDARAVNPRGDGAAKPKSWSGIRLHLLNAQDRFDSRQGKLLR